jgi:hypothetical protein
MTDHLFKANSIVELKTAFAEAGKIATETYNQTINLNCTGVARTAMEAIFIAKAKRNTASTVGAGGTGVGVGMVVASATAPFLGPFCLVAGMVAGALAGKSADDISRGVFLGDVIKEYGEQLVFDAREYKRRGDGAYFRIISGITPGEVTYSVN